jgi:septal ring factor EnvC (AmiA/AmiB activator)
MLKKGLIVGAAAALLLALLFGSPFIRSHVATWWEDGKQFVNELESTRNQIKRARIMIKDLTPVIADCEHKVAQQEVDVDDLRDQVDEINSDLAARKSDILRLSSHLDNGGGTFYVAKKAYPEDRVREDLALRLAKYKAREEHRNNLEEILQARERGLKAVQNKLGEMRSAKSQLEIEVEGLESRLEMIEVKQVASDVQVVDDSALADVKELMKGIKTRLDVADKMLNADTDVQDLIPLEEPADETHLNIEDEVARYFGENRHASDGTIDLAADASK